MKCDDFRAAFLAGELDAAHFGHLDACGRCRAEQASLGAMADALADPALWDEPRPDLADTVMEQIAGAPRPAQPRPARKRVWPAWVAGVAAAALIASVVAVSLRSPRPDWEVAIAGVGTSTGLEGTVRGWSEPAGTRVAFDVAGLDEAPAGRVYELWFSRGPVHISGGTFASADDAELLVGVARRDYPRIWVTLEPLDADPGPSGEVVLDTRPRDGGG